MNCIDDIRKVPRSAAVALLIVIGVVAGQIPTVASAAQPQLPCEQLTQWRVAAKTIGLPTRGAAIETATLSAAGDPNGSYCKVNGAILSVTSKAQPIRFQVNLPKDWNGKAIHAGGGGYDGMLVD